MKLYRRDEQNRLLGGIGRLLPDDTGRNVRGEPIEVVSPPQRLRCGGNAERIRKVPKPWWNAEVEAAVRR